MSPRGGSHRREVECVDERDRLAGVPLLHHVDAGHSEDHNLRENGVRLAHKVQVGRCIPVGIQYNKLKLAQHLGQLGDFLTLRRGEGTIIRMGMAHGENDP